MESKLSLPTITAQLALPIPPDPHGYGFLSKLHRNYSPARQFQLSQLHRGKILCGPAPGVNRLSSFPFFRSFGSLRCGFARVSCSASSFASRGGNAGGDNRGRGGGDGDNAAEGGEGMPNANIGGIDDISPLSSDVIILDVRGMTCGGCAASVKRILENQPEVSAASVDLTKATAVVLPSSEAKIEPNWQKRLGEALAKHLSSCGFESSVRGEAAKDVPS